jgi:predicted ferric reductase
MTTVSPATRAPASAFSRDRLGRAAIASFFWLVFLGNGAVIVFMWVHGGNLKNSDEGDVVLSIARITGLLGAYLALWQVILLTRLPWLERLTSFDRLSTVWHKWNGHACVILILIHTFFSIWGYQAISILPISFWGETKTMIWGGVYPGMIVATIGTFLLVVVAWSSIAIVRRRLSYEWWYAVHITAYAGIALGWFHQIPTGNELIHLEVQTWYWRSLYIATLVLIAFRVANPVWHGLRYRMRVVDVVPEGPGVVSFWVKGRRLDHLHVKPGQFFIWRFLKHGFWWTQHPFSISRAPDGDSLRITIKDLGDHTAKLLRLKPGTHVVVEGPFGAFVEQNRVHPKVLYIAGGIGITPIRALAENTRGDAIILYRAVSADDLVFRDELDELAKERGIDVQYVVGDHNAPGGEKLLSAEHLRELVPDIDERDIYLCGPPAMVDVVDRHLHEAGVPRRNLHVERFTF